MNVHGQRGGLIFLGNQYNVIILKTESIIHVDRFVDGCSNWKNLDVSFSCSSMHFNSMPDDSMHSALLKDLDLFNEKIDSMNDLNPGIASRVALPRRAQETKDSCRGFLRIPSVVLKLRS